MSKPALQERAVDGRIVDVTLELDELSADELVRGLRDAAVASALAAKHPDDAVPVAVWWGIVDALRRSLVLTGAGAARDRSIASAVVAVERASWQLTEEVPVLLTSVGPAARRPEADPVRALRRAQVLVARLVLSTAPASPTLLQVRLHRLSAALVANLSPA
jgi:hypothetical protein